MIWGSFLFGVQGLACRVHLPFCAFYFGASLSRPTPLKWAASPKAPQNLDVGSLVVPPFLAPSRFTTEDYVAGYRCHEADPAEAGLKMEGWRLHIGP